MSSMTEGPARALPFDLAPVTVVTGHYGVGKTTLALNLAIDAAAEGRKVTLIDLDVVNPYFRSSEYEQLLESHGVRLISPVFSGPGTSLDVPALSGAVIPALEQAYGDESGQAAVIIDAGGDEVGARVLGRFAPAIEKGPHQVLYVVNFYRNQTQDPAEAAAILSEITEASRLEATALVNNSHLKAMTDADDVAEALVAARQTAAETGLPLLATAIPDAWAIDGAIPASLADEVRYPVISYVATPWE